MALTDKIAQQIMGEIDTLTRQIDKQTSRLAETASQFDKTALRIKENADEVVKSATEAAKRAQMECAARAELQMTTAATRALNEVANAVAIKSATKWVVAGVVIAGVLIVVAGYLGYSRGKDAGEKYGYAQARDEIAAAAWTHTLEGKQAYQLAKVGSISLLATCKGRGWKIEKNLCVPYASEDATYGWLIK